MLRLDAYNRLLQAAGEIKVDAIDGDHPMHVQVEEALDTADLNMQVRGWWFNKYTTNLQPNPLGVVVPPAGLLAFDGVILYGYERVLLKGNALIKVSDRTPVLGSTVKATMIERWDFEQLPDTAAEFVVADACLSLCESFDADGTKLQTLQARRQQAYVSLHAEHVRQAKVNMLRTSSMMQKMHRSMNLPRYN